jgi:hypothetical protein
MTSIVPASPGNVNPSEQTERSQRSANGPICHCLDDRTKIDGATLEDKQDYYVTPNVSNDGGTSKTVARAWKAQHKHAKEMLYTVNSRTRKGSASHKLNEQI